MTFHPALHGNFTIERIYDADPARVFHAWADLAMKARLVHRAAGALDSRPAHTRLPRWWRGGAARRVRGRV